MTHLVASFSAALLAVSRMAPSNPRKRRGVGPGRARCHAVLTPVQVMQILDLRECRGWSCRRIAMHLHLSFGQVQGVCYGGNGTRTIFLKRGT